MNMWEDILSGVLDETDIKILNLLLENGRMSDKSIGDLLKMSKSAIRARRLRLQENGYIKFIGLLVLQNLNLTYIDLLIKIKGSVNHNYIDELFDFIENNDHIYEITEYVGDYDFLIRIFDKNLLKVKRDVYNVIHKFDIIEKYKIMIAAKSHKAWGIKLS
ncbi:hypothetical protein AOG54_07855 [Acidiplasma aeolicum]|uniref:HTH asnC-type domain-containing protein n=3 Tax=Acidiplasma aeolicum TaxID=507754 RepID=A0A0Q1B7N7_9ARCH|nr:hypothetical protein AOG54_07855 [Acidiplasma aeolicum]